MNGERHQELYALLSLLHTNRLSASIIGELVSTFGSAHHAREVDDQQLLTVKGMTSELCPYVRSSAGHDLVLREMDVMSKLGVEVIFAQDANYPSSLKQIYGPPIALFVRGAGALGAEPALAIVGTRKPTAYGLSVARHLSTELTKVGFTIISGLARGIDTEVHQACLDAGGKTIAVLGNGHAVTYPRTNHRLTEDIVKSGVLLTEFTVFTPPRPYNFPIRNRIIAGLSIGVIVVEATSKSGALITANHALEQGREVFAVPGPITSPQSEGPHGLIKQGAALVGSLQDILEEFQISTEHVAARSSQPINPPKLDEPLQTIFTAIGIQPIHIDELVRITGLEVAELVGALTQLTLLNLVTELPGKLFKRA